MKKRNIVFILSAGFMLASCENKAPTTPVTYFDSTAESIYGKISDFSKENKDLKVGDELTFNVKANQDFFVESVTNNGKAATLVNSISDSEKVYKVTLEAGKNKLAATYSVDPSIDFVDKFKLNIDQATFDKVMSSKSLTAASDKYFDFRKDGIELMNLPNNNKGFINYVDGDTTHVETMNYGYTVKIRYLGIDTPESTSEIEEWGKSASLYNKSVFESAKYVILQSQGWARGDAVKATTADGNQRSLAYVWYTTNANPTLNDFRCLNLEMVYQGFSQGIGSIEEMGEYFYKTFDKANLSAKANLRHQYSGKKDPNYYYYDDKSPFFDDYVREISLKELYLSGTATNTTDSKFVDGKTLYKIHGYVSRKIKGAFYIQDKADYGRKEGDPLPEAYGLYVFTYAQTDIKVGDEVSVIGQLSVYGGCYQIQGISYSTLNPDLQRDTQILTTGNKIVPIPMTINEFNSDKAYNNVLITLKETVYSYNKTSTYNGVTSDSAEGGVEEVNKYNEKYPFYNTDNKIIFYAKVGNKDTGREIRLVKDKDILVKYGTEYSRSYKFFTGGTSYYNPKGAEKIYPTVDNEDPNLIVTTYKKKEFNFTGILGNYVSSSGKTQQYTFNITHSADITNLGEIA